MPVSSDASFSATPAELVIAVRVSAGLQPAPQLGVQQHHDPLPGLVDDERGPGQVTGRGDAVREDLAVLVEQARAPGRGRRPWSGR